MAPNGFVHIVLQAHAFCLSSFETSLIYDSENTAGNRL